MRTRLVIGAEHPVRQRPQHHGEQHVRYQRSHDEHRAYAARTDKPLHFRCNVATALQIGSHQRQGCNAKSNRRQRYPETFGPRCYSKKLHDLREPNADGGLLSSDGQHSRGGTAASAGIGRATAADGARRLIVRYEPVGSGVNRNTVERFRGENASGRSALRR